MMDDRAQPDLPQGENKPTHHVLVTGGQGYIGSHTVLRLLEEGFRVTVVDNGSNSCGESLERVRKMAGAKAAANLAVHGLDLRDAPAMRAAFRDISKMQPLNACVHFAGLKSVGESVTAPLKYYQNNVAATLHLLEALQAETACRALLFSSSATVYGSAQSPVTEASPVGIGISNPYGRSKFLVEEILTDFHASPAGSQWGIVRLRYFNPCGAHPSGLIGEDPSGPPNNLMPYVAQVAVGRREVLTVFGDDYDTPDGTGVRDYIHVMDLAEGHLAALRKLFRGGEAKDRGRGGGQGARPTAMGHWCYNLGTGTGVSVLSMVAAMERASGRPVRVQRGPRRVGDVATCFCDPSLAEQELGWKAQHGVEEMCADLWKWQAANPSGYAETEARRPSQNGLRHSESSEPGDDGAMPVEEASAVEAEEQRRGSIG